MAVVYFITEPRHERVKIGCTTGRPEHRLGQLQTGTPYKLSLHGFVEGDFIHEGHLHKYLAADRVQGEWFEMTDFVVSTISALISGDVAIEDLVVDGCAMSKPVIKNAVASDVTSLSSDFVDNIQEQYVWSIKNGDEWKQTLTWYIDLIIQTGMRPNNIRFDIDPTSPWVLPYAHGEDSKYITEFKAFLFDFACSPMTLGRPYVALQTQGTSQ